MLKLIVLAVLLFTTNLLSGCSVLAHVPPDQAVRLAIAQNLTSQQQNIAQALNLDASKPNFKLEKIDIQSRQKITSPNFKKYPGEVYKVRGTFESAIKGKTSSNLTNSNSPFELYLSTDPQDTSETQTWYLLHP